MTIVLLLLGIHFLYYISYLFSVAASGLYLSDYDEQKFILSLSERRRAAVRFLLDNPKLLAVSATLVQSATLVVATVLWYSIGSRLGLEGIWIHLARGALIVCGWTLYYGLVSISAPRLRQERALGLIAGRAWILGVIVRVMSPVIALVIRLKASGRDRDDYEDKKEEIIERAIEELADSAGIDEPIMEPDVRQMISNVFELSDSQVREVMVPRIEITGLEKGATIKDVQRVTAETGHSRFPVYEEDIDNIIGILYVKDMFKQYPLPQENVDLTSIVRPAYFVPETKELKLLLEEFKKQKIHIAIAVDEYGGTAGLVTMEDLLELIVGDIQDEHDTEEEDVVRISDNEYLVSANLSMYDLSEKLDLKLEEKDFETVGGYIYDLVGSVPETGQRVSTEGVDYIVEEVDGQRIEKVRVIISRREESPAGNLDD